MLGTKRIVEELALFAAGIGVGVFLMQPGVAQEKSAQVKPAPGLRLNHVGIYAKDYERSREFFTKTIGLREAFTIRNNDGQPTLTYLQINRDTFLELAPATGDRQPGLSHVGIWPENLSATVAALRARGVKVDDPRTGATLTSITNVTDPDGVRLELLDFLPGSLPRKAIDAWK